MDSSTLAALKPTYIAHEIGKGGPSFPETDKAQTDPRPFDQPPGLRMNYFDDHFKAPGKELGLRHFFKGDQDKHEPPLMSSCKPEASINSENESFSENVYCSASSKGPFPTTGIHSDLGQKTETDILFGLAEVKIALQDICETLKSSHSYTVSGLDRSSATEALRREERHGKEEHTQPGLL